MWSVVPFEIVPVIVFCKRIGAINSLLQRHIDSICSFSPQDNRISRPFNLNSLPGDFKNRKRKMICLAEAVKKF